MPERMERELLPSLTGEGNRDGERHLLVIQQVNSKVTNPDLCSRRTPKEEFEEESSNLCYLFELKVMFSFKTNTSQDPEKCYLHRISTIKSL